KRACDNLYLLFLSLYEWELDVRFVRPHEAFEPLFQRMQGWTTEMLAEFRRIPRELDELLTDPGITGEHTIRLVINAPDGISALTEELERISQDPRVIAAIANCG